MAQEAIFRFITEVNIEYDENHPPTPEQLEWLKELSLKAYLSKPLSERVNQLEEDQVRSDWELREYEEMLEFIGDATDTYLEIEDFDQESVSQDESTENSDENEIPNGDMEMKSE